MTALPKRKFTAEFRSQAVKLVREGGVVQAQAARQLGISEQTLATWVKQARRGNATLFAAAGARFARGPHYQWKYLSVRPKASTCAGCERLSFCRMSDGSSRQVRLSSTSAPSW